MAKIKFADTIEIPTWILVFAVIIIAFFIGLLIYNHEKTRVTVKTHGPYAPAPQLGKPATSKKQ